MAGLFQKPATARSRALRPRCHGTGLLLLILATPVHACHLYRVWHYPKSQKCFTALTYAKPASRPHETFRERINIMMLPALDWTACPDGDERLQGIAKLRALSDGSIRGTAW